MLLWDTACPDTFEPFYTLPEQPVHGSDLVAASAEEKNKTTYKLDHGHIFSPVTTLTLKELGDRIMQATCS